MGLLLGDLGRLSRKWGGIANRDRRFRFRVGPDAPGWFGRASHASTHSFMELRRKTFVFFKIYIFPFPQFAILCSSDGEIETK